MVMGKKKPSTPHTGGGEKNGTKRGQSRRMGGGRGARHGAWEGGGWFRPFSLWNEGGGLDRAKMTSGSALEGSKHKEWLNRRGDGDGEKSGCTASGRG